MKPTQLFVPNYRSTLANQTKFVSIWFLVAEGGTRLVTLSFSNFLSISITFTHFFTYFFTYAYIKNTQTTLFKFIPPYLPNKIGVYLVLVAYLIEGFNTLINI